MRAFILFLVVVLIPGTGFSEDKPPNVALTVIDQGMVSEELSSLLISWISKSPAFNLVERESIEKTLTERELIAYFGSGSGRGVLSGVDLFINVLLDSSSKGGLIEYVAPSGHLLGLVPLKQEGNTRLEEASKIFLQNPLPKFQNYTLDVKTIGFVSPNEDLYHVLTSLEVLAFPILQQKNYALLSRRRAQSLSLEALLKERGFVEGESSLVGADLLVLPEQSLDTRPPVFRLSLINVSSGSKLISPNYSLLDAPNSQSLSWLLDSLSETQHAPSKTSGHLPEALHEFLAGLRAYSQGDTLQAVDLYTKTLRLAPTFPYARTWRKIAYEDAGFSEIAEILPGEKQDKYATSSLAPGLAFYGLNSPIELSSQKQTLEVILAKSISHKNADTLWMGDEVAFIAQELDLLVGLEHNNQGPSWQEAPFKLFEDLIFGDLENLKDGLRLTLTRIKNLSPDQIQQVSIVIPSQSQNWEGIISEKLDSIFAPSSLISQPETNFVKDREQLILSLESKLKSKNILSLSQKEILSIFQAMNSEDTLKYIPLFPPSEVLSEEKELLRSGFILSLARKFSTNKQLGPWINLYVIQHCEDNPDCILSPFSNTLVSLQTLEQETKEHPVSFLASYLLTAKTQAPNKNSLLKTILSKLTQKFPDLLSKETETLLVGSLEKENSPLMPRLHFSTPRPGAYNPIIIIPEKVSFNAMPPETQTTNTSSYACPLDDPDWRSKNQNLSHEDKLSIFPSLYQPCTMQYGKERKTSLRMENLSMLSLFFFQVEDYAQAQEIYLELITWEDENGDTPDPELKTNALFLLALIELRNKNQPQALEYAKSALNLSKSKNFKLLSSIRAWSTSKPLEAYAGELVSKLRLEKEALFYDPFSNEP